MLAEKTSVRCAHFTGQVDAYVGELAVAFGLQRRGIGTRLMDAAEAWAARSGREFLTLETGRSTGLLARSTAGVATRERTSG